MAEDRTPPLRPIEPPSNNVFQFAATKYSNCTFSIIDHPSYPPLNIKNIPCAPENISRDERILPRNQAQFRWQKTYFLGTLRYFQGTIKYFLGTLLKDSGALIPGINLPPPRLFSDHLLEPQHHLRNNWKVNKSPKWPENILRNIALIPRIRWSPGRYSAARFMWEIKPIFLKVFSGHSGLFFTFQLFPRF